MASQEGHDGDDMHDVVMREMRSKENARFLRRMPAFKLPDDLPRRLSGLLEDLERAERGAARSQAGGAATGAQR
jgi:hypothetical protein